MRRIAKLCLELGLAVCVTTTEADLLTSTGKTLMQWPAVGKIDRTVTTTPDGHPVFTVAAGNNNGVWTGPRLPVTAGRQYRLDFRYRIQSGELLVIAKHGNNTYGALSRKLTGTNNAWREFRESFVNRADGNHASLWFMGPGKFELSDIRLTPIASAAEQLLNRQLTGTPPFPARPTPLPPDLTGVKLIAQEWHLWFSADIGGTNRLWQIWNSDAPQTDCYRSSGPLWRRAVNDLIYPYLGPYSAENPDIIRWQIGVMKNCGLDGTMCQMYPVPGRGEYFCNEDVFETCLKIAEEENYRLGVHDEIQFMQPSAKSIDAFVERAVRTLRMSEKYPRGYLHIENMPVYQYEAFAMPWTAEEHDRMMAEVEKKLGKKVFWMVSGPVEKMVKVQRLKCLKNPATLWSNLRREDEPAGPDGNLADPGYWQKFLAALQEVKDAVAAANAGRTEKLRMAPWIYPGFNNATWKREARRVPAVAADREKFFLQSLGAAMTVKPTIINLAGWNERSEKTALEPSWNNENPDPFYLVKLIAAARKITFKAPPLPPKEAVDPMMWSVLYGIDRTPPRIVGARAHVSEANLAVDCLDDLSGVEQIAVSAAPLAFARLTARPIEAFNSSCTVSPAAQQDADGVKIEQQQPVSLRLALTGSRPADGDFWLGFKYRAPPNTGIRCRMQYRRTVPNERFKLNNNRISTVPNGPVLVGSGESTWYILPLCSVTFAEKAEIGVEMTLTGPKSLAPARLEAMVLFPGELRTEAAAFALPAAGKQYRSFMVQLPERLLPRNFFNIPLAVQCRDAAGNLSPIAIFEFDPAWQKLAPAAVSLDCGSFRWFK